MSVLKGLIVIFCVAIFCNYTYYKGDKSVNPLRIIGDYIDDTLHYKMRYERNDNFHKNEVVIIKVDEKTLNSFQKSNDIKILSFSKSVYADLLENIFSDYHASVVGIDIVFANKSNIGDEDEDILKEALNKYSDRIVIGTRSDLKEKPLCKYNLATHGSIESNIEPRIRALPIFSSKYNPGIGCENGFVSDENLDGIYPLSVELVYKYYKLIDTDGKRLGSLESNLDIQKNRNDGLFYINFSNNKEKNLGTIGFKSYSLIDILEGKTKDENGEYINLFNKVVLIGEVGTLLHDRHFSPVNFERKMPGVEFHANAVTTMLYNDYLLSLGKEIILLSLILTCILLFVVIESTKTFVNLIASLLVTVFHIWIGRELFIAGYIYPIGFFIYSIIISFIVFYVFKFIITERHRKFIKKAFSMYISPEMVDMISADATKLNLKGNKSDITVFFSDIANFTKLSEKMKTEDLFSYLNEYFTEMTEILTNNSGTLDKYIGDAIMGFFNAPIKIIDHAFLACKTALEQQEKLIELNKKWTLKKKPCIEIRIGINSGEMMHGNIGSVWKNHERINYTVMGDQVNLASRLEGVNKYYGTNIIISEATHKQAEKQFLVRELDNIKVKGKSLQTKIYELIGYMDDYKEIPEYIINYEKGLKAYYNEMYNEAILYFKKNENDKASKVLIKRCNDAKNGNIKVIDGVYEMDSK